MKEKAVNRAYKFRLYPNKEQKELIDKTIGCSRFVYNELLARKIHLYNEYKLSVSKYSTFTTMPQFKMKYEWLKEADSQALLTSLADLDTAFKNFFRRVKQGNDKAGFPKFKSKKNPNQSYRTAGGNKIELDYTSNKIKLPKLRWVKARLSREPVGELLKIFNATVSRTPTGKYFVSVCVEELLPELPKVKNKVGIDVGLSDFAITSDGDKYENPKWLRKEEEKLARLQRILSRKTKGTNSYEKARLRVAKLHEKITNQRKDYLHKVSTEIVNENQVIAIEDLKVSNMLKNKRLSKAISEVSWYEFRRLLEYKCDWYGRELVIAPSNYASSQLCSNCGYKNKEVKNLALRHWVCPECNAEHDRDINASKNLLKLAMQCNVIQHNTIQN